jgi:hypothetical protein
LLILFCYHNYSNRKLLNKKLLVPKYENVLSYTYISLIKSKWELNYIEPIAYREYRGETE